MFKRIIAYIQNHFFLRNLTVALCLLLVLVYLASVCLKIFTRHGQRYAVPVLIGKTLDECRPYLKDADLKLEIIDSMFVPHHRPAEVLDQSPKPDMNVKSGRRVFVVINSERPRMEEIPFVAGYSLRQAKNILESRGFEISKLVYVNDVATNNVIDQYFKGKRIQKGSTLKAELGSGIDLYVGNNPSSPLPIVPKVIGLTLREAKSRLWEIGLNIGDVVSDGTYEKEDEGSAKVWRQVPNQQERAVYGTAVTLSLTVKNDRIISGSKTSDEMSRKYVEALDSAAVDGQMETPEEDDGEDDSGE